MAEFVVIVCTARRPRMLQACLESLVALDKSAGDRIRIVVVENDVEPRSLDAVNDIRRTTEIEVLYVREPRRGIPVARNAGIRYAAALNADWIALIDDDETANSDWLKALYDACRKFGADIASGPVRHKYEVSPPHWWSGPTSRNWPTGQQLKGAHTNNILMKAHLVAESGMGMRFDERLLAGSEDVEFFERAVQIGARIVWAANAGVSEAVPLSRVAPMRLLSREYMVATSQAQVCRIQRGALVGFLGTLPKIIRRAFTGSLFLIAAPVAWMIKPSAAEHLFFSGAFRIAKAAGNLVGGLGIRSRYYMSTDGR